MSGNILHYGQSFFAIADMSSIIDGCKRTKKVMKSAHIGKHETVCCGMIAFTHMAYDALCRIKGEKIQRAAAK